MEKDKKERDSFFLNFLSKEGCFFKNFLSFIVFFIFFGLSVFFALKRHSGKGGEEQKLPLPQKYSLKVEAEKLRETTSSLKMQLESLSKRVTNTQTNIVPPQQQNSDRLIALQLLKGVLDGLIPLEALKKFLQTSPQPWKASLLADLASVGQIKTYPQLSSLLSFPSLSPPASLWKQVKKNIKSLILIRKVDGKRGYEVGQLDDLQKAIQAHDLQKANEYFEKLPIEEKARLSAWKKLMQDRLTLETQEKALLLEMAGEQSL